MSTTEIIIAGFGGQGILYMGQILSHTANNLGKKVSWLPSYGPEMRGGTAHCMICISGEDVNSPLVLEPDILVAMNKPSLIRFEMTVKHGGSLVLNSDLIDINLNRSDVNSHLIQADTIALKLGDPKIANMAALGALIRVIDTISLEQIIDTMKKNISLSRTDAIAMNIEALRLGYDNVICDK